MQRPTETHSPENRRRADLRLRTLTRSAILAATGAAALVGVVVAHEHPGASSPATSTGTATTTSSGTSSSAGTTSGSSAGTTPTSAPAATTSPATVTSGGTSS